MGKRFEEQVTDCNPGEWKRAKGVMNSLVKHLKHLKACSPDLNLTMSFSNELRLREEGLDL